MKPRGFAQIAILYVVAMVASASSAFGQFQGENFRGDYGVNSGTQGPAGIYVIVPYGQQNVDRIKDVDGKVLRPNSFQGFDLRLIFPMVYGVTSKKILGGNYGFNVAIPFTKFMPERPIFQSNQSGWAITDTYVSPFILGWTKKHADFLTGYAFNAPTGSYEAGGSENTGLGMWSHEISGGTTVYLDTEKKYSVATTAFLEIHTKKKDQDLKVGEILTLEGGAAYNIEKLGAAFGVGYSYQGKITDDSGADIPVAELQALNLYGKNRVFSVGPDLTTGLFEHGRTFGLLNVRYLWEKGARSSFEGSTFYVSITIGRLAH